MAFQLPNNTFNTRNYIQRIARKTQQQSILAVTSGINSEKSFCASAFCSRTLNFSLGESQTSEP